MYYVEANLKDEITQGHFQELTKNVPLYDLVELSSTSNRILASFVSAESAESFAASLRAKDQPAVVYEGK